MTINFKNWQKELQESAPVAPVPGQKWKDHAVMVNGKQRVVIDRKNVKHYPEHEGWKEVPPGVKEELVGNQHKLDVDKDGKIERSDLKKLRSKKDEIFVNKGENVKEDRIDELSVNKMLSYRSKATEKLGTDASKEAKRKEGIRVSGEKVKEKLGLKKEEVKVGDKVHLGVGTKGGAGYRGTVHKIDGETVHVNVGSGKWGDRIVKGHISKLTKEEVEQIDELNKDTLVRYSNTARTQAKHDMAKVASATSADELEKHSTRMTKRLKGNAMASRKMQEDGNCKKTYREFVEYLQNNLIEEDYVEVEEELNLEEEQLDEYDAKTGRYVHKGTYGTSYQGDDDDEDEDKPKTKPVVKRGRGRPAGSKSGARQQGNGTKSYGGLATHSLNLPNRK